MRGREGYLQTPQFPWGFRGICSTPPSPPCQENPTPLCWGNTIQPIRHGMGFLCVAERTEQDGTVNQKQTGSWRSSENAAAIFFFTLRSNSTEAEASGLRLDRNLCIKWVKIRQPSHTSFQTKVPLCAQHCSTAWKCSLWLYISQKNDI